MQLNIKQNNLQNVLIHNIALGNREDTGILYGNHSHSLNMSLIHERGDYKNEFLQTVPIYLLSSFLKTEVALLKIDVEGSEHEIVHDIVSSGKAAQVQRIIIEFHPFPNANLMDLENQLAPFGFKLKTWTRGKKAKETLLIFSKQ